jgi:hypothetical protein
MITDITNTTQANNLPNKFPVAELARNNFSNQQGPDLGQAVKGYVRQLQSSNKQSISESNQFPSSLTSSNLATTGQASINPLSGLPIANGVSDAGIAGLATNAASSASSMIPQMFSMAERGMEMMDPEKYMPSMMQMAGQAMDMSKFLITTVADLMRDPNVNHELYVTAMLRLADDIGKMADRILVMADIMLVMGGLMQEVALKMLDVMDSTQNNVLTARQNLGEIVTTIPISIPGSLSAPITASITQPVGSLIPSTASVTEPLQKIIEQVSASSSGIEETTTTENPLTNVVASTDSPILQTSVPTISSNTAGPEVPVIATTNTTSQLNKVTSTPSSLAPPEQSTNLGGLTDLASSFEGLIQQSDIQQVIQNVQQADVSSSVETMIPQMFAMAERGMDMMDPEKYIPSMMQMAGQAMDMSRFLVTTIADIMKDPNVDHELYVEAMLRLADDIGKMADRVLVMADKMLVMGGMMQEVALKMLDVMDSTQQNIFTARQSLGDLPTAIAGIIPMQVEPVISGIINTVTTALPLEKNINDLLPTSITEQQPRGYEVLTSSEESSSLISASNTSSEVTSEVTSIETVAAPVSQRPIDTTTITSVPVNQATPTSVEQAIINDQPLEAIEPVLETVIPQMFAMAERGMEMMNPEKYMPAAMQMATEVMNYSQFLVQTAVDLIKDPDVDHELYVDAMLRLSDDIGAMADRILIMADKMLVMGGMMKEVALRMLELMDSTQQNIFTAQLGLSNT